ncbi:MAG: DUF1080 domain-containing protein [Planctomycetota bacterium]|nr:DUF1080 domain-containing protein [Planctomycetota bacterium]
MLKGPCQPILLFACSLITCSIVAAAGRIPEGFLPLFNGKDLSGWRGLGHENPKKLAALDAPSREKKQREDNADLHQHWRVQDGIIINDGQGVFLTTAKDYGDFELLLDWRMIHPGSDSGIYLRGCPQIQIWDPDNPKEKKNGAHHGSGAMWNNNPGSPGRFPLVCADKPIGEWNRLKIRMLGDRVTVHLNAQLVVDDAVMHNYFDRGSPMFAKGPIQIQTHGGEMQFRNIYLREISENE